jgi:hypothetical protein
VRNDLQGLEIGQKELQKLTNLPVNDELIILTHPMKRLLSRVVERAKGSEAATVIFIGMTILVSSYVAFDVIIRLFVNWVTIPSWLLLVISSCSVGILTQIFFYILWKQRSRTVRQNMTHSLKILLNDVERHSAVIKAIDINDQIEAAGNSGVSLNERKKVIEALKMTRNDLVRALKTERILRENKKFIVSKLELFADNLPTLTVMQVSEEASEHGRWLNEVFQIALDVQQEMKSLQSQGS